MYATWVLEVLTCSLGKYVKLLHLFLHVVVVIWQGWLGRLQIYKVPEEGPLNASGFICCGLGHNQTNGQEEPDVWENATSLHIEWGTHLSSLDNI